MFAVNDDMTTPMTTPPIVTTMCNDILSAQLGANQFSASSELQAPSMVSDHL